MDLDLKSPFLRTLGIVLLLAANSAAQTKPWKRHTIDNTSRGADGVRLADVNGDGRFDLVTPWEEGGSIRVYLQPKPADVRSAWPKVEVGKVRSPEDALLVDLDGDGRLDVLSCCEGRNKTIYVHWAPRTKSRLLDSSQWKTMAIPCTRKKQSWMFAVNVGRRSPQLVVGSKGRNGAVGRLLIPRDARNVGGWTYRKLQSAKWIMSLVADDVDQDGQTDVVCSDRLGSKRGVYWLRNDKDRWTRHNIGGRDKEVMFLTVTDLDRDGQTDVLTATRNKQMVFFQRKEKGSWRPSFIDNPFHLQNGKAVAVGDIDLDGRPDIVHTANTGGNRGHHGAVWMNYSKRPTERKWKVHSISGRQGVKFDLVKLLDLDGDGDLDVLTCEERDNLGVFWYENPYRGR